MVIGEQQMEAFSKYMRRQFEDRMVNHIRASFSDQTRQLDEQGLRKLVILGINRAEGYGIAFEDDIQRYLEYMMLLSQDFDTNPRSSWAGNILLDDGVDGAQKIARIDNAYLLSRR